MTTMQTQVGKMESRLEMWGAKLVHTSLRERLILDRVFIRRYEIMSRGADLE
jgi:hypothetical protein